MSGHAERRVIASDHAVQRFLERYRPELTLREAHDQVAAAVRQATLLPKVFAESLRRRDFRPEHGGRIEYWFHGDSRLVFVTERGRRGLLYVLTALPFFPGPIHRRTRDARAARRRRKADR